MTEKEAYYRQVMNKFTEEYGLTEEEFLRIYNSDDYWGEKSKLPKGLQSAFCHLFVAYRRYLRDRGEFKD